LLELCSAFLLSLYALILRILGSWLLTPLLDCFCAFILHWIILFYLIVMFYSWVFFETLWSYEWIGLHPSSLHIFHASFLDSSCSTDKFNRNNHNFCMSINLHFIFYWVLSLYYMFTVFCCVVLNGFLRCCFLSLTNTSIEF